MENKVTLELTVEQLNVVMAGLSELPLRVSRGVFQFIQVEASKQLGAQVGNQPEGPLADKVVN